MKSQKNSKKKIEYGTVDIPDEAFLPENDKQRISIMPPEPQRVRAPIARIGAVGSPGFDMNEYLKMPSPIDSMTISGAPDSRSSRRLICNTFCVIL